MKAVKRWTKKLKADAGKTSPGKSFGRGLLTASGVWLILAVLLAAALCWAQLPFESIGILGIFALTAACMAGGWAAGAAQKEKGLVLGGGVGAAIYALLLAHSIMLVGELGASALYKLPLTLAAGMLGGVLGVNRRRKAKRA